MIKLAKDELFIVSSLIKTFFEEYDYPNMSVQAFLDDVAISMDTMQGVLLVDNKTAPTALAHVMKNKKLYSTEHFGFVGLIYVSPPKRNGAKIKTMLSFIKNYSISIGCDRVAISATSKRMGKLWKTLGAKKLETLHIID